MDVYLEFLGYQPYCTILLLEPETDKIKLGCPFSSSNEWLKEKIKEYGYKVLPNPRFKDFPEHLKFVKELNNG